MTKPLRVIEPCSRSDVCWRVLGSFASLFYFRHFPSIFAMDAHVPWGYGG